MQVTKSRESTHIRIGGGGEMGEVNYVIVMSEHSELTSKVGVRER